MAETAPADEQVVELRGGLRVTMRLIRADDEARLHEAFSRMSERSVYFRFFSPLKRLPDELAHRLATVDYSDRYAVVAVTGAGSGEQVVGVGRYDRAPGTATAEVAVAVVDEFQRRGLGAALLSRVAAVARRHDIETFTLIVLPENQSMLALLRRLGWVHRARFAGGVYEITFEVGASNTSISNATSKPSPR